MINTRLRATVAALLCAPALVFAQAGPGEDPREIYPAELPQHLVKILRTTNKAQTNRYVPKVYDFKHANPFSVLRWVRRTLELEEGAWASFANPDLVGGKIVVVCPEYQIPGLDELMALIDRTDMTTSGGTKRITYRLRHRDGADPGLQAMSALEGTQTANLFPDPLINGWLVEDVPSGINRIAERVAEIYDVPTPQAEAKVKVYEINVQEDGQLGLDYIAWKNGPGRNLFAVGAFAEKEKISSLDGGAGSLVYNSGKGTFGLPAREYESTGRNGAYLFDLPSAYFDFLVERGKARIVTRAKLVALHGTTSLLEVGEDILYYKENHAPDLRAGARLQPLDPFGDLNQVFDTSAAGELTDTLGVTVADHPDNRTVVPGTVSRSLGTASAGFFFQYTPTISTEVCFIDLFCSFVDHIGFADDGTPVLAARTVDTRFKIPHDGREITIGAQMRKRRVDSTNKIPWLGDLPILGSLFGGESHLDQKSLVLVTFQIERQDFPYANETDNDALVRQIVDREVEVKAGTSDPGFIRQ